MKLHLGCGTRHFDGWINLDIDSPKADIIDDATKLTKILDDSCEVIYASHILEHFGRKEVAQVLSIWYSKLKTKGVLRLSVPDWEKVIYMYSKGTELEILLGFIVGGQKTQFDFHKMIFDKKLLTKLLLSSGFKKVRLWDWRKTEHSQYDDYSQAYLPHMDKEQGIMMSLNIEAIK